MEDLLHRRGNLLLGIVLVAATGTLLHSSIRLLEQVREATRVSKAETPDSAPLLISRRTEDAIHTETLGTLTDSPNFDIRQAATKMLVERVFRTPAYDALLRTVSPASANPSSSTTYDNMVMSTQTEPATAGPLAPRSKRARQARALVCLRYLHVSAPVAAPVEHQVHTIYALVAYLASRNARSGRRVHEPDTDWRTRSQPEADALAALAALAPQRLADTIHAGVVTKWLAHFPFGGAGAGAERRRDVVKRLCERHSDDADMTAVMTAVMYSADGRRQLRVAGLIGSAIDETKINGVLADGLLAGAARAGLAAVRARSAGSAAGAAFTGTSSTVGVGGSVGVNGSAIAEEAALRRRRRQAMVYGEQGQPVTRDNIYEGELPDHPWQIAEETESDDELAQLINGQA